jgi:hypothetical protein
LLRRRGGWRALLGRAIDDTLAESTWPTSARPAQGSNVPRAWVI